MAGVYRNLFYNINKYVFSLLPDTLYHNLLGYIMHKRAGEKYHWMNIKTPRTFSEKIQWLKSHGDNFIKTKLADKYEVRSFVSHRIGSQYLIDILPIRKLDILSSQTNVGGGYRIDNQYVVNSVDEIDFNKLPSRFVLKLTKGSGYNIICNDKSKVDFNKLKNTLCGWLKVNNFYLSREPQYKGKNRIYCEKMLEYNITDYKFFCFDGEPFMFKIDVNRFSNHRANYYDMECNLLPLTEGGYPQDSSVKFRKPKQFDEMAIIARNLSNGFKFVRVDLYIHDEKVYFGELTFHPAGGYASLTPREWEFKLGDMIKL